MVPTHPFQFYVADSEGTGGCLLYQASLRQQWHWEMLGGVRTGTLWEKNHKGELKEELPLVLAHLLLGVGTSGVAWSSVGESQ